MPNNYLDGITPAEAIRYKTHATGVEESSRLTRSAAAKRHASSGPCLC